MEDVTRRLDLARRALATLEEVLREPASAIVRDASIQRFEYSFEAAWKAAQRYLRDGEGLDAASPAASIRQCHAVGILDEESARRGLDMIGDRNLTVHTYKEEVATEIALRLPAHATLLRTWLEALQERVRDLRDERA